MSFDNLFFFSSSSSCCLPLFFFFCCVTSVGVLTVSGLFLIFSTAKTLISRLYSVGIINPCLTFIFVFATNPKEKVCVQSPRAYISSSIAFKCCESNKYGKKGVARALGLFRFFFWNLYVSGHVQQWKSFLRNIFL